MELSWLVSVMRSVQTLLMSLILRVCVNYQAIVLPTTSCLSLFLLFLKHKLSMTNFIIQPLREYSGKEYFLK